MALLKTMKFDQFIGKEVGSATLLKELGRGAMAVIFVAFQKTLKRQIAVKILPKSFLTPITAELFQQEAESAAILSHPNIVQIYEVGDTKDFLFFTMQLINGRSIADIINRRKKHVLPSKRFLPVLESINIVINVLDALDYAHSQDIVHRDIKPANILIESHTSRPIITDFGIAKLLRGPTNQGASIIRGTPIYMAPEQILKKKVDGRADIYATGTMLFEMLVSNLPLPAFGRAVELLKMKLILKDRLIQKRPSAINPLIGEEMEHILFKAISYDPENRYATCRAFLEDLKSYRDNHLK